MKVTPARRGNRKRKETRQTKDGGVLSKQSDLYNGLRDESSRDGLAKLLKQDGARLSSLVAQKHSINKKDSSRTSFPFCDDEDNNKVQNFASKWKTSTKQNRTPPKKNRCLEIISSGLQSATSALICTLLEYFSHFSFAAVIFSHEKLQPFIYMGFVANLVAYVLSNIVYASFGTFKFGILSTPSFDVPVMAGAMATIANLVEDETQLWPTAFLVMCMVSITLGVVFMVLGRLKLLAWTNFIPTPVISGFLAGNGVALMKCAFTISAGKDWNLMTLGHYGPLLTGRSITLYLPAIVFGTILSIGNIPSIKEKYAIAKPQVMFILLFVLSNVIFYIIMGATGSTIEEAIDYGWLFKLSDQAKSGKWWSLHEVSYSNFTNVDWKVAADAGFVPSLTITIILLLGQAMRSAGTSELIGVEGDSDRDSVVIGSANVLSGLLGGRVTLLSTASLLNVQLAGKDSQVATWLCVVVGFCFLLIGHLLMQYAPKFICGGALFFLGVDITNQMVVASFYKLPTSEFLALLSVLAVYLLINPMYGMGLGVFLTTGIFVAQYVTVSSESVISDIGTGKMYHSTVHRSLLEQKMLKALSGRILVAKLQGYLFFGNTAVIKKKLRTFIEKEKQHSKDDNNSDIFLILNMHQVVGCDTTATNLLLQFTRQIKSLFNIHTICAGLNPSMYRQFNQHGLIIQLPQFAKQDCTVLDTKTGHGADNSSFFGFKKWQLTELEKRFCIFDDGAGRIELSDPELLSTLLSEFGITSTVQQVDLLGGRMQSCYNKKRVDDARINWIKIFFRVLTATITDTERDVMYEVRNTIRYVDSAFGEVDDALQWVENQLLSSFEEYMKTRQQQSVLVLLENSHLVMAEGGSRRHLKVLQSVSKIQSVVAFSNGVKQSKKVVEGQTLTDLEEGAMITSADWSPSPSPTTEVVARRSSFTISSSTSITPSSTTTSTTTTTLSSTTTNDDNKQHTVPEIKDTATKIKEYDVFTQVVTSMVMEMELADRMVNGSVKDAIVLLRERVQIVTLKAGDCVFQTGQTVQRIVIVLQGSLCVTKMLQQKSKTPPYRRMVRERVLVKGNVLGYTHYYWKHRPIARWNAHAVANETVVACLKFHDLDNIHVENSRLAAFVHFMFCGDACRDATERLTKFSAREEMKREKEDRVKAPKMKRRPSVKARHRR